MSLLIIDECAFLQGENGGEDLISGVLPMLTKDGQVFFSSTPAGKNNYFARLFLDAKPGDGIHRIVVRGTDIPRLVEWKVSEPRRARRLQNDVNALERKCRKLERENRKLKSQLSAAQGGGDV